MRFFLARVTNRMYTKSLRNDTLQEQLHTSLTPSESEKISSGISYSSKGSLTVEAALVLPVFLFFMMNILFSFQMLESESRMYAALHQTGNEMTAYGYALGKSGIEGIGGNLLTIGYAGAKVKSLLGNDYLEHSCVAGGSGGLSFLKSAIIEPDNIVKLNVTYKVKPFISGMGFEGFYMQSQYYGKAWTGYDPTSYLQDGPLEDPIVYITKTGTVYHLDKTCQSLNPSVEMISKGLIGECRNIYGAAYKPCLLCGDNTLSAMVYITDQGESYHSSATCAGLKRTIYTVRLSEVEGRRCCLFCSK